MEFENPIQIPDRMYFKIGDVAKITGVKTYILRYWESEFSVISPNKTNSQQRMYTRTDVEYVLLIKHLLYEKKFSIQGARQWLSETRKKGELTSARKLTVAVDQNQWQQTQSAIESARKELKELIALCQIDN